MEVLAKPDHTPESEKTAREFLERLTVIPIIDTVEGTAIAIRRGASPRPKLPDAIVAATALVLNAKLVTADDKLSRLVWPGFTTVLAHFL
jgi:predicted nucleic acid-binding protein